MGTAQINFYEPIGQSFTAIDAALLSVGFQFREINPSSPQSGIQVDLYDGTGTGGTLLGSRSVNLAAGFDDWYDFDFTGVTLSVGQVYSAALSIPATSPRWGVTYNTTDTYSGGAAFFPGDLGCNPTCDLGFRVVGEDGGAVVPEPATWALMIGGFGGVGAVLRRRKVAAAAA